jgi:hypothetical protein
MEISHLNQGIHFMSSKNRHSTGQKSSTEMEDYLKSFGAPGREGFQEGADFAGFIELSEQILDLGGSKKGEQDSVKYQSLADAKNYIKNKADFYGFEYEAKTKKTVYRSYFEGALPKNSGKIPTVRYAKGWTVYLKANNGMPESKLASIGEGNAIEKVMARERQQMQKLENSFNNYLNQYKTVYKAYLDEIVAKQGAGSSSLRNSIRKGPDGLHYYVSGMGVIRQFDAGSWETRDRASCSDSSGLIKQNELDTLTRGAQMGQGEVCRTGGYNAKSATGDVAWVDAEGMKHVYQDYASRHNTCPQTTSQMSNQKFNAIPDGKKWTDNDGCVLLDLDTEKGRQAIALNDKLIEVAGQMQELVNNSEHKEELVRGEKAKDKKILLKTLGDLKSKRGEIGELRRAIQTARVQSTQQGQRIDSIQLKYISWTLAGLTIGLMALRQIKSA